MGAAPGVIPGRSGRLLELLSEQLSRVWVTMRRGSVLPHLLERSGVNVERGEDRGDHLELLVRLRLLPGAQVEAGDPERAHPAQIEALWADQQRGVMPAV